MGMSKKILYIIISIFFTSLLIFACAWFVQDEDAKEVPAVTWYVPGTMQSDINKVMDEVNKIAVPQIGAKLKIEFFDESAYYEKISLCLASKSSDYDLCFVGFLNEYQNAVRKGSLLDLSEYIEEYPSLKSSIPDYAWDMSKADGKIYGIPNMQILATSLCWTFPQRLIDKYSINIDSIKNSDDVEPYLEIIKNSEPNLYPARIEWGPGTFKAPDFVEYFANSLVCVENDESGRLIAKATVDSEWYRKNVEKLNRWYKRGYIRKDIAAVNDDLIDFYAGKYAAYIQKYKPGIEAQSDMSMNEEMVCVQITEPFVNSTATQSAMTGINKYSKNPEKAMEVINLVNTNPEVYNLLCFGIEGEHYIKIGENKIKYIPDSKYAPKAAWKFGNQFNAFTLEGESDDVWEQTEKINNNAKKSKIMGFTFNTEKINSELSECTAIKEEYPAIENGSVDPKEYFDEYRYKLKANGIDKIVQELQMQIDEFINAKQED